MPEPTISGIYHAFDRDPERWGENHERLDDPDEDSYVLKKHGAKRATAVGSMEQVNEKINQLEENGNLTAVFYWTWSRSENRFRVQVVNVSEEQLRQSKDWPQIGWI